MRATTIYTLFICNMIFAMTAFGQAVAIPKLPATGKSLENFIPKDWQLLKRADGDLNKDGLTDNVVVIEYAKSNPDSSDAPPRLLFVVFQQTEGFQLAIQADKAILKSDAGGVMGDPFQNLTYNNNSFLISFYGGSRERWGYDLRFRYQDNGWFLIGFTKSTLDSTTGKGETEDYNLLTGQMVVTAINGSKESAVKKQRGKKTLVNLKDFDVETLEELQY